MGMRVWAMTTIAWHALSNPEGIQSFSPGLIGECDLPWDTIIANRPNPERVESAGERDDATLTGLGRHLFKIPRVDRCAINPGLDD
jgi:hypothetical protein